MLRRTLVTTAILAGIALGLVGPASAQTLEIKIGAANSVDHAPAFVGVEKGIFAKHGLDAKIVMYQTGVEMINGLLNDAQDVNIMGSIPFLAGASKDQPLMLIGHLHGDATKTAYTENVSIVATGASGVAKSDIKALAGKKIGTPRGAGAEGFLVGLLPEHGLKTADVTLLNIKPSDLVTALRQGDVDAIAIWEPWGSTAVARVPGAVLVQRGGCMGCYDPGTILTTKSVIAGKAEQLRRFMVAFSEAEQWVRQNYDAAAEINMRWMQGVDLDVMKIAIRHSIYDPRPSKNTLEGYKINTMPQLLADKRMAKELDPASIVDPQFYLHALKTAPQVFADLPAIPADKQF